MCLTMIASLVVMLCFFLMICSVSADSTRAFCSPSLSFFTSLDRRSFNLVCSNRSVCPMQWLQDTLQDFPKVGMRSFVEPKMNSSWLFLLLNTKSMPNFTSFCRNGRVIL
uniref:(northern house mosquito) hypothetical protein n=1 Tax=Culex pipiens TaxID=7175 RepID=A0A8D8EXI2_CULPI